jgi:hypothetical protein
MNKLRVKIAGLTAIGCAYYLYSQKNNSNVKSNSWSEHLNDAKKVTQNGTQVINKLDNLKKELNIIPPAMQEMNKSIDNFQFKIKHHSKLINEKLNMIKHKEFF